MWNSLHKKLWHIFQLIDAISIVLLCEIEDMNEKPNKHDKTMLDFEKMIQNDLIRLKTFLKYKKFIFKCACNCHYCTKIGFEDLANMCKKGLSCLYTLYEEIISYEKNLQNNEKNDKIFLHRLKLNLFRIIRNLEKIQNKITPHLSNLQKIPNHIAKKPWKTLLKKYY